MLTIMDRINRLEQQLIWDTPVDQLIDVLINRIDATNGLEMVSVSKLSLLVNRIGEHILERDDGL